MGTGGARCGPSVAPSLQRTAWSGRERSLVVGPATCCSARLLRGGATGCQPQVDRAARAPLAPQPSVPPVSASSPPSLSAPAPSFSCPAVPVPFQLPPCCASFPHGPLAPVLGAPSSASQPRPPLPLAPPQVCCTGVLPRCGCRKQVGLTLPRAGHIPLRDLALPLAVRLWMTTCVCREPGRRHPPQGSLMPAVRKSPRPCCCGRFAHNPVQGSQKGLHFST